MYDFADFEWYDFVVIGIFAKVMQVLVFITLAGGGFTTATISVSYTHLRAHET